MTEKIRLTQTARFLDADTETPISLYLKLARHKDGILLESAEVDGRWGRYSILACDFALLIHCDNGNLALEINDERLKPLAALAGQPFMEAFSALLEQIEIAPSWADFPPITRALFGFMGFGMGSVFNPHLQKLMPLSDARCILGLPSTVMVFDHLYNRLCQLSLGEPQDIAASIAPMEDKISYGEIIASPTGEGYKEFVARITDQLRQGEAIQVVPSTRFCTEFTGDPFILYRRMRRINASPYMFYMKFPAITLFGSSPEVMVRCIADKLELSPIAGTRKRATDPAEDRRLAEELLNDPKDCAEHVMLVDLGRNDLGRIAVPGTVELKEYMQIQRFSHVMHMTSEVTAELAKTGPDGKPVNALMVLAAAFPAGTVSGAPKFRAMEIIRQLEGRDRGPYAGCVGWIGLDQDSVNLDMGITIRSMWLENGRLCWQAGGGIVHDSSPEAEWQEVCNKSAIMRLVLTMEEPENVPAYR